MTRIAAFTALQKALGQESAEVVAEYIESQQVQPDLSHLTTKDDFKDLKIEMLKEFAAIRQEIAKTREEFLNRLIWTAFIQVLTVVGAIIALVKFIPN
jgi:hypothetical protein